MKMKNLVVVGIICLFLLVSSISAYQIFCSPIDYSNKLFWDYSARVGLFPIKDASGINIKYPVGCIENGLV